MRRERRRNERGSIALMAAVLMPAVIAIGALVVDLGMERVTRSDLQSLADVVALDLAREIHGGRSQDDLEPLGDAGNPTTPAGRSVARNAESILGDNLHVDVDWGAYDGDSWDTAAEPPSAVRVTASADTAYALAVGSGHVSRTAYAVSSSSACYRLGTFVAAVRTGDSTVLGPLNDLFGVNLGIAGYQALADAQVTLSELAATSVVGSPEQLLYGNIGYDDLLRATVEALTNRPGPTASAAITALNTVISASGSVGAIVLSDVLHVSPTDTAALGIDLDVLDIVGSARLANGEHFLDIDNLQAGVPGVGFQFTGRLALISAAQLACGDPGTPESVARNAQLEGTLGIDFANLPSINVDGLGSLQTGKATGSFHVSLADGEGRLVSPPEVHCGSGTEADPHTYTVAVQTQPATYSLRTEVEVTGSVKASILDGLGLGGLLDLLDIVLGKKLDIAVKVRLDVGTSSAGGTSYANLRVPPNDVIPVQTGTTPYLDPRNVVPTVLSVSIGGKSVPALDSVLGLTNRIVDELVGVQKGFAQKTLLPLIDNFNNTVVGPVARMVGLRFGGADVYAVGAVCGRPALRG